VGGAASQVNPATAELDEEQHIQALEPDRVDREEVGGQDLVGVLAEELAPAGPGSEGRRRHAMAAEDSANGLVGAAHAELEQFTLDPTVTPAGVLASQAQDGLAALGGEAGASAPWTAGEHCPSMPNEIAMPAHQGLSADEEAEPGRAGQESAETCE
jgi:hypothetical protein